MELSFLKICDTGEFTRRVFIQRCALLAATARVASAAGFQGPTMHHVSLYASDLERSIEFYHRVFGCSIQRQNDGTIHLLLERSFIVLRRGSPPGTVDHFAIGVEGFDREPLMRDLKLRGAEPINDPDAAGLHIKDPDGFPVQVTSNSTYSGTPAAFPASRLDHVSVYTSDLKRSVEYYRRVFGFPIMTQGAEAARLSVGSGYITLRGGRNPAGIVDHFAIGMDGFNRESVIRDLRSRGTEPADDPVKGLHVKDPDGFPVQVIANDNGGRG